MIPIPVFPNIDTVHVLLLTIAVVAGLSRGVSGFGGALLMMPPLAAVYGPVVAAPAFILCDATLTLPILHHALRKCIWRDLLPLLFGAVLGLPVGVAMLVTTDPILIRWVVSLLILTALVVLASGWRYPGEPAPLPSFAVGSLSGVLAGFATVGGPPVIVYWLGSSRAMDIVRANIYAYFGLMTSCTLTLFFWRGLFTAEVLGLYLILLPSYGAGLLAGSRMFKFASPTTFRRIAYVLIAVSALSSLPVLDAYLRPGL